MGKSARSSSTGKPRKVDGTDTGSVDTGPVEIGAVEDSDAVIVTVMVGPPCSNSAAHQTPGSGAGQ